MNVHVWGLELKSDGRGGLSLNFCRDLIRPNNKNIMFLIRTLKNKEDAIYYFATFCNFLPRKGKMAVMLIIAGQGQAHLFTY